MNADRLLSLYDKVAEAPGAIPRLRRFVLDLAVRGKLVEQNPKNKSADSALKQITATNTSSNEFPLPKSWKLVNVETVAKTRLGKMLDKAKNRGTPRPYLRNINVRWFDFDLSDLLEMRFEDSEIEEFSLKRGDVLICEGGEPGRAAVWDERAENVYFQKAIHRVRFSTLVDPHFFLLCLKASAEDGRLAESFTGTGIQHFTGKALRSYRFPLPPLPEQHRIVAKVEELMTLLDQLETARTARETTRDRLTTASLTRLTAPETSAKDFPTHARFALNALPTLTARPDQIKPLRQTILNLAVRGKLVPQNPRDEPAVELLKQIAEEKAKLIKTKGLTRIKTTEPITVDDKIDLPKGWAPVFGFDLFPTRSGNSSLIKGKQYSDPANGLFPGFSASGQDVWLDKWEHEGTAIVLSAVGARCGKAFLATGKWCAIANTHIIWLLTDIVDPAFAMLHLNNEKFWLRSGGAQPFVKVKATLERSFPLPPFSEQLRIVAKVEELMILLDQIETTSTTANTTRDSLLESLLLQVSTSKQQYPPTSDLV